LDKEKIELIDFENAIDRVIGGLEKKHSVMTKEQRKIVAYHEAGHAVAGWFLEHADPLLKVTIVPRSKGSLGWAQYLPKELGLYTQTQLYDEMCVALGGRAAEQVFFNTSTSGAADDLKKITKLAYHQIAVLGMGKKLGQLSFPRDEESDNFTKPFSELTAQGIDEEANQMVAAAFLRTMTLLQEKKALVEALAIKLLDVESVNHDALVSILGPRPFISDVYATFLKHNEDAKRKAAEETARKAAEATQAAEKAHEKPAEPKAEPDTGATILSPA
jgi:ATP-dependent Zn protease